MSLLNKFTQSPLGRLLTFNATKPTFSDEEYTIDSRLKASGNKEFVGVWIHDNGARSIAYRKVKKQWEVVADTDYTQSELPQLFENYQDEIVMILINNTEVTQFEIISDIAMDADEIYAIMTSNKKKKFLEGNFQPSDVQQIVSHNKTCVGYSLPKSIVNEVQRKASNKLKIMHMSIGLAATMEYVLVQSAMKSVQACIVEVFGNYIIFGVYDNGERIDEQPIICKSEDGNIQSVIEEIGSNLISVLTNVGDLDGEVACFFTSSDYEDTSVAVEQSAKKYCNVSINFYDCSHGVFLQMLGK